MPRRSRRSRPTMDWKLSLAGLLIGLLVGMTGMGGGSLMTPLLVLVFGFKPSVAIGTDIVHGAIFKSFGAIQHRRLGHVHARLTAWMLLGSVPFSIVGVAVAWWLTQALRRRLRGHREGHPRDRARLLRARVPRQGLPPHGLRRPPVHPRSARPGDRRADGDRRGLRRRADLGRERHGLRARDADRVPAHRGEDRRHGHLPRRDPARRRRRRPSRRGQRRPQGDRVAADRLDSGRPHRRQVHGEAPRPLAPDHARRHAHARRGQARRSAGREHDPDRRRADRRRRGVDRARPLARQPCAPPVAEAEA